MTLTEAIAAFLDWKAAKGDDQQTIDWYVSRLSAFSRGREEKALDSITMQHLEQYVAALYGRRRKYVGAKNRPEEVGKLTDVTVDGHIRVLRTFFKWCKKRYELANNPAAELKRKRKPQKRVRVARPQDVQAILRTCSDDVLGRRDLAILLFMAATFCRREGVVNLRLKDLHLDEEIKYAHVKEKFDKERDVFLAGPAVSVLKKWLDVRPGWSDRVFVSLGDRTRSNPLLPGAINQMIERRAAQAGVTGDINPHSWRHLAGMLWDGDEEALRILMGHESLDTTKIYRHHNRDRLYQEYQRADVLGKILGLRS